MIRGEYQKKQKKIRLAGKHVFLTYPKCSIPLADCLELLSLKLRDNHNGVKNYIISHEEHKDGTDHRHMWIELCSAPDYVGQDFFDIDGHHGNYQSMKFTDNCAKYVLKGGEYITSFTPNKIEEMIENAKRPDHKLDKRKIGLHLIQGTKLSELVLIYPALIFDYGKLKDNVLSFKQDTQCSGSLDTLEHEWIWGPTGVGKSKSVNDNYPEHFKKSKEIFWDSYQFEDVVVLEDVDETWEDVLWELKVWADHYPFAAKIKHKPSIKIRPKKIVVTSNYTLEELMVRVFARKGVKHDPELIRALERRFKHVRMDKPSNPDPLGVFPENYFALSEEFCMFCSKSECVCYV